MSVYADALTLKEAVAVALDENPYLKAYSWSVRSQKEVHDAAKSQMFPRLKLEEKFIRTDNPTYGFMAKLNQERFTQEDFAIDRLNDPSDISDFQTSFGFEQPLFVPKIYYGMDLAAGELAARETDLQRARNEVARNVIRTALAIQTAREYLKAAQLALQDSREHKRLASLRYETGLGLYSDVLRADTNIMNTEAFLAKAEGDLEISQRSLGRLLGKNEAMDISDEKPHLPLNAIDVYLDAADRREDLKAMILRYENSLKAVEMEKTVFLPELSMDGSYLLNDHNNPFSPEGESYVVMAFLRWNIFDISSYHKVKKAEADTNEMKHRLAGLQQEIRYRVHEAYIRIREKAKSFSLSKTALEDAEEALRLVRARYENSLTPMVDLLDTQSMVNRARAKAAETENEYINAVVDLYYESGLLLKTLEVD